jgi:outer membrane lipase/esterase
VVWNHEFDEDNRSVTAALTTAAFAPSYSMPAVDVGKDWGTADIGATVKVNSAMMLVGAFTSEFGDHSVMTYGGQLGLNLAF